MTDEGLREELLKTERVFEGHLLRVRVDTVRTPDGVEATREVVEHPGAAAVVPVLDDGRAVLVRQFRQPAGKVLLEIPAGCLQPGEAPEACAQRELAEEVGYRAGRLVHLTTCFLSPGYSDEQIHIYLATGLERVGASPERGEVIEPAVIALDDVPALIEQGQIQDGKTIVGLLLAMA
jgi:ADP-ribose pyrophosphatase